MADDARPRGRGREAVVGAGPQIATAYNLLRATVRTFEGNTRDVLGTIDRLVDELVRNVTTGDEEATATMNREVGRTFFNWLCAVNALVDHTRGGVIPVFTNAEAPFVSEYHARRAAMNEPSLVMVRELRNYAAHSALPAVFSSLRQRRSHPPSATVFLGVESLLRSTRWSAVARGYLEAIEGDVELRPLVECYASAVDSLYSWLGPMAREWGQHQHGAVGPRLREWGD